MKKIWTPQSIIELAQSCKNRTEFYNKHSWAYQRAREFGIMDEIYKIFPLKQDKLNFEIVREIAKKYKHRVDFKKGDNRAWQWASNKRNKRKEFYKEITSHMTPKGTWYKKLVYRYDFSNNVVYFGITNDRDQRIKSHKKTGAVYEYSVVTNESPRYTEITDYIDKIDALELEKSLINEYKSLGWNVLNKTNGGENGGGEEYITKELCHQEALKYNYRWEFGEGSPVFYQKANKRKWMDEICSHMDNKLIYWDEERILDVAQKSNLTLITEFAKLYSGAYKAAEQLGIKQKLRDVFDWKGGKFWTKEEIWEIAKKHTVRSEFIKENPASSFYAQRKGWYDEITSHMGYLPKGKKWTKEEVFEEALKYKTRNEFNKNSRNAYQSARHNKWLDDVCGHMIVGKGGKIGPRKVKTS